MSSTDEEHEHEYEFFQVVQGYLEEAAGVIGLPPHLDLDDPVFQSKCLFFLKWLRWGWLYNIVLWGGRVAWLVVAVNAYKFLMLRVPIPPH